MKTISQEKSPQQILSIAESSVQPRRAQYRFEAMTELYPCPTTLHFIGSIFALVQKVAEV